MLKIQVRDSGPPTLRAGRYLEHDGRQYLYSYIAAKGVMQFQGSQELEPA